ncbi:recombinase family protein [Caballeronia sp. dw_276]|uniref:recombinase family protein n=1 Tax=Caballeronia sp. dw_276 TaxID=2719795 RepID=UPI001BD1DACF|nr:recombinase family protein [Caballeronia sp. dw_276]
MSRLFCYCRVSTNDQTVANQILEIQNAGFAVDKKRAITETVSGSIAAMLRPGFASLVEHKLESGDVLIVTKLDRLGRSAHDVRVTIDSLATKGIRVHCLQLGGADLTSPAGRMVMGVLNTIAEFELDLLRERTHAGLDRARAQGKTLGRPSVLSTKQREDIAKRIADGASISSLARELGVSRQSIQRARATATA